MTPERSPRPRHDPRDKDVSDQLPEEQQEGASAGEGPRTGTGDRGGTEAGGATEPERDTTKSTGNPGAAG
jgi:hypothetical protein